MSHSHITEHVLVIPTSHFERVGSFHGFRRYDPEYHRQLLDPEHLGYRPRSEVETDLSYKQLIPYVVLKSGEEVFHYVRGGKGTEKRLEALRSIGIGGHINLADGTASGNPYRAGMLRELNEEVQLASDFQEECIGFIYDDRTAVGAVHLGIVHVLELESPLAWAREESIEDGTFASIRWVFRHYEEFETWSQLVLDQLMGHRYEA